MDLIIRRERAFEDLIRSFDIMIWIRAFDAFDDTSKNEKYEKSEFSMLSMIRMKMKNTKKNAKKKTIILENDLNDKKKFYIETILFR